MGRTVRGLFCSASLAAGLTLAGAGVRGADDDLAVVQKAVAGRQETRREAAPRTRWLRVRVFDKASNKATVVVNVPLPVAHALGDVTFDGGCHGTHHSRCERRLSDVLASLEAGQRIVEVDGDETTVRVWVD